jgi:quercetin dioxygenase-like cupin family protein
MRAVRLPTDGYTLWLEREGVPVYGGHAVEDLKALELAPWPRLGGRGAYVRLEGAEDITGMYVCEIPPGGTLRPERHLYEEVIYCLSGNGSAAYWRDAEPRRSLDWKAGSLFSSPLNVWHELSNASADEPARFMAVTSAPPLFKLFRDPNFIFDCDYTFDRYDGRPDYFSPEPEVVLIQRTATIFERYFKVNLVPDLLTLELELMPLEISRGEGLRKRRLLMAGNELITFVQDYAPGTYTKAHAHEPGFQVFIISGTGFTLMWPPEAGIQPYQDGHADKVVRIDFGPGTIMVPPRGWFHQNFNTGRETILYAPTVPGGRRESGGESRQLISVRHGGTQIDYDLEDPRIRELFAEDLRRHGATSAMTFGNS